MVKHLRTLKAFWYLVVKRNKELATLQLDVTADCNLRCKTCYFFKDDEGHHMSKDMPLAQVEALFKEYRDRKVYAVWLFGGEPTLRPEVIDLAYRYFPLTSVISNGKIKVSEEYRDMNIHISLDGLEKDNDFNRGRGTFKKIMENYTGDKRVIFNFTITRENLGLIDEMVRYAKGLGVRGIEFQLYSRSRTPSRFDERFELFEADMDSIASTLSKYHYDPFVYHTHGVTKSWREAKFSDKCRFSRVIDCYASDGARKPCCTPGIPCDECKMFPTHFVEAVNADRFSPVTAYKFLSWQ